MPKITLKRVIDNAGAVAELYPTTTLDQIISEGTGLEGADESLSSFLTSTYIPLTQKGAANGVATLDGSSKITYAQIPDAIFGGLKFAGTITDNGDYGNLSDVIIGSPASSTITVSNYLDSIANVGQDTYDTQTGLTNYEAVKNKWIGYYWVVAGTATVTMEANENSDGSGYYGASAFEDGVALTQTGGAQLDPGDWLVISGWDETLNTNNGGFIFSVVNNTYGEATNGTKGVVQLSNAANTSELSGNDVVTEGILSGLIGAIGDANKLAPAAHNHDTDYYTETEIGNILGGSTGITGYNKTNWDNAYSGEITGLTYSNGTITLARGSGSEADLTASITGSIDLGDTSVLSLDRLAFRRDLDGVAEIPGWSLVEYGNEISAQAFTGSNTFYYPLVNTDNLVAKATAADFEKIFYLASGVANTDTTVGSIIIQID
jgi:hypothetical protein